MNEKRLPDYCNFGFREYFITHFKESPLNLRETPIAPKQVDNFERWLRDGGLLKDKQLSPLGEKIVTLDSEKPIFWELLWITLANGSRLIEWFVKEIEFDTWYSNENLDVIMAESKKAKTALKNTLKESPIGTKYGWHTLDGKSNTISRLKRNTVREISPLALLYGLYRLAEANQQYSTTVGQLLDKNHWEHGVSPATIFGFVKDDLIKQLRGLSTNYPKYLSISTTLGLDNVGLQEDIKSDDILALI